MPILARHFLAPPWATPSFEEPVVVVAALERRVSG